VAALIKLLVEDFIEESSKRLKNYDIGEVPMCGVVEASEEKPVAFSSEISTLLKKLKRLLREKLYRHMKIAGKMHAGKQCVKSLYEAFSEDENLLPISRRELFEKRRRERVIADYIASMTDRYAIKIYHELYGYRL
jgi:dGTPase